MEDRSFASSRSVHDVFLRLSGRQSTQAERSRSGCLKHMHSALIEGSCRSRQVLKFNINLIITGLTAKSPEGL